MSKSKKTRSPSPQWHTAVLNDEGERIAVAEDPHHAWEWARRAGFDEIIYTETSPKQFALFPRRAQNPCGQEGPYQAWKNIGFLRIDIDDVMKVTLEEARQRILRLRMPMVRRDGLISLKRSMRVWPLTDIKAGEITTIKRWQSANAMARNILSGNDKLAREFAPHPSRVTGLSLLPALNAAKALAGRVSHVQQSTNFCAGSNAECRNSCLVYTGQNESTIYNMRIKEGKSAALMADPVAFGRLLYENCKLWGASTRNAPTSFVRLNVYSDIPWELVFPGMFAALPTVNWYDYTKVPWRPELCEQVQADRPGRAVRVYPFPKNYDLTFSASGSNDVDCRDELSNGRRIAVVFETDRHVVPQWWDPPFWPYELPVVNGDQSDLRPFDPSVEALNAARKKLGGWTLAMGPEQRDAHIKKVQALAYRNTFGRKGAPESIRDFPNYNQGVIVGLTYKQPFRRARAEAAEAAQEKGRAAAGRSDSRRAFLVPVVRRGEMMVAPSCPKTVSWISPVTPGTQPGVIDAEFAEGRSLVRAAKQLQLPSHDHPARKKSKKTKAKKKR